MPARHLLIAGLLLVPCATRAQTAALPEPTEATRRHLTARRATARITIDGALDEADWQRAAVASDFVISRPDYMPTSPWLSRVRVLFDDEYLYIGVFNADTMGTRGLRVPDLRRDFEPPESDDFAVTMGTLGDRRTAFQLHVSPYGSQGDVQAFDGGDSFNFNWDAMWRVRTTRSDSGWVAELAVPWESLRYTPGLTSWDINFVRNVRRAFQWSSWMPYPRQFSSWRLTYAGVLDSLAPPPPRTNLRVRPYALGQASRDRGPGGLRGTIGDVGGEVIWAPTTNSLVEATVNTDFAQADVDRQVVNLTRFSVFFPERRQFFLENADLLNAGGLSGGRFIVQPFFSRRIGLADDGTLLPIDGGVRYAYRTGRTTAGALAMRQAAVGGQGAGSFGIARASQFFGRATRLGATVAVRDDQPGASNRGGTNVVTALEAFGRVGEKLQLGATLSTSADRGRTGVAGTYGVGYRSPTFEAVVNGAVVDDAYDPRTGFVSRPNVLYTSPTFTWTLQPSWKPRSLTWIKPLLNAALFHTPDTRALQEATAEASVELLSRRGGWFIPFVQMNQQRPTSAVPFLPGVTIAPGAYDYLRYGFDVRTDQSAAIAGAVNVTGGDFFDGGLTRIITSARWSPNPFVAMRMAYELSRLTRVGTRDTSVTTHLAGPELRVFLNPRVQWSAFYQYNTAQQRGTLNARFSWEFTPLSFLYVVYNDRQAVDGGTSPRANSLIVKLSWLRQM
ncbi:MAG: carbohydrate binding family 9 domain-containing protein [Gemmatimonadaceae bacterium]|nr:carbohydrate binding family 9 domain-containing protein [Gemmatimonadaceae bacterium]